MKDFVPPSIEQQLNALSTLAWNEHTSPRCIKLAWAVTNQDPDPRSRVHSILDELNRRFKYRPDPIARETMGPVPWSGGYVDVDDACLFLAFLAMAVGIRCRIVGARMGKCWTCFVACELDGFWECFDPLRQPRVMEIVFDEWLVGVMP